MDKPVKKIMIVGEDLPLLYSLAFTLKRHGYLVASSSNTTEALKTVSDAGDGGNPFSLLITDIRLPGLDELEHIDILRKRAILIPILVMTAYRRPDLVVRLDELHIKDLLTKPFNSDELVKRVSSMLEHNNDSRHSEE
jgi:DNA-binding response OmpR family regulator